MLPAVWALVEELTVEHDCLITGAERAESEHHIHAALVQELEAAAVKRNNERGVLLSAVRALKNRVTAGKSGVEAPENRAHDALD